MYSYFFQRILNKCSYLVLVRKSLSWELFYYLCKYVSKYTNKQHGHFCFLIKLWVVVRPLILHKLEFISPNKAYPNCWLFEGEGRSDQVLSWSLVGAFSQHSPTLNACGVGMHEINDWSLLEFFSHSIKFLVHFWAVKGIKKST